MSLKYRLIILTLVVFAATFGLGTLLAMDSARQLAETQLVSRLGRSAEALAASGAPLNQEVLGRLAPVLDTQIMVLGRDDRMIAHSAADWAWSEIHQVISAALADPAAPTATHPRPVSAAGRRFYFAASPGLQPETAPAPEAADRRAAPVQHVRVVMLADESAVLEPTRSILTRYLVILGATALLLGAGSYLIGWLLVRRIDRLSRSIDQTLAEDRAPARPPAARNELTRLQAAFDDLLGRLQLSRERLAAQQRLATTGKLASSVAHEVRNPLQAIRLTLQLLREKAAPGDREGYDVVLGELDRLNLLTDELLVLAGKDTLRVEAVDLARELRETARLLRMQFRQREICLAVAAPADLPAVRMDRNRCRQMLLNLLLNAAEASPRGGSVCAAVTAADGRVRLEVADSGAGFPAEVLSGQTEEFYSTKSSGAGLGLSICRTIVQQAGGELRLANPPSGGALAEVTLPAEETAD